MFDVYDLLNSRAIEDHCRKIEHKFNTLETACIICRCTHLPLHTKRDYYKHIIDTCEDMKVGPNFHMDPDIKLFSVLQGEIERINLIHKLFVTETPNTVYTLEIQAYHAYPAERYGGVFATRLCIEDYLLKNEIHEDPANFEVRITKHWLSSSFQSSFSTEGEYITARYRQMRGAKNWELMDFWSDFKDEPYSKEHDLQAFYLNIPHPFEVGDMVYNNTIQEREKPMVIMSIPEIDPTRADSFDMQFSCFWTTPENGVYADHIGSFDNFEFHSGKVDGIDRILTGVQSLLREEIPLNVFIPAYNIIMREHATENQYMWWCPEAVIKAGLTKEYVK